MILNPWDVAFGLVTPLVVSEPTYRKRIEDDYREAKPDIDGIRNQPGFLKEKIIVLNDADFDLEQISKELDCNARYVRRVLIRSGRIEACPQVRKRPASIKPRKSWRTEVVALTLDGQHVATHESISKASIAVGCSTSAIHLALKKKIPTAKGYQFMELEEYERRKGEDLSVKFKTNKHACLLKNPQG